MQLDEALPVRLPLDADEASLTVVGGKGASLARLAAAGLPVPPGFHLTTTAYRHFVAANALQTAIVEAATGVVDDDPAWLAQASATIQGLFQAGAVPEEIAEEIRRGYAGLGEDDPAVAVRSSATAEDLPEASFAGQQETYLNIRGEIALLDAVRRCWASLWTARAIGYRVRQGILPEDVSLAVVVQVLVPADAAGVLFTANPVSGARDQVMINAGWGLGEAVVSGLVTPDTVVVDRASGAVVEELIGDKDVMTVRTSDGTEEVSVPAELRTRPVLSVAQAVELTNLGLRIEQLYGQPMDIEWALHGGQLFILQARPITTLSGGTR
jgi:rifampicin phosphotransferase